jgi:murein DD-endopeptidase MepM/ murein hydrolase activator NlpD
MTASAPKKALVLPTLAPKTAAFRAFVLGSASVLLLLLGGRGTKLGALSLSAAHASEERPESTASCPEGTLPDGDVCVHLPSDDPGEGSPKEAASNGHRERSGKWSVYEQIPRLPDRPAEYEAYEYPIPPGLPGGKYVVSGYDLDRPDALQRRGRTLSHVGHGGLDLPQKKGTPVALVALEHQQGDAEVLYAGRLFGTTVVTRHSVREAGRVRDYLVLFGHLDSIAEGISAGVKIPQGTVVGAVGDTGSPELVHLHLEVRRARDGVDLARVPGGGSLVAESVSVVCDPRNVLPLRPGH